MELELPTYRTISKTMIRYNFTKRDYNRMRDEVENLLFFHSEDEVEKAWTDLRKILTEIMKKFVPITKLNPVCRNNLLFTNTARQALRAVKKYWNKFCCNRTTVNFDNYKEKRNAVKAATRNDQKAKERELLKI